MHRRSAFTLVELLLVVTVITILIALLLPAFSIAKESTRRSICANNLHQVHTGLDTYIRDYQRKFPGGNATISPGHGIDSTYVVPSSFPMGLAHLITFKYLPEPRMFYCPSWTHPWNRYDMVDVAGDDPWFGPNQMGGWPAEGKPGPTSHRGFSYHYRSSFGAAANRPPSLSRESPSHAITADHWVRREVLYGKAFGHKHGFNALYLDGQVSWRSDDGNAYMLSMSPEGDGIRNGMWAWQEIVWRQFFDR